MSYQLITNMIKFTFIDAYNTTTQFQNLASFDMRKGDIISWEYSLNLGDFHQIIVRVSPQFARYKTLREKKNFGIRLQTSTLDLVFLYKDRVELEYGVVELKMVSSTYKLQESLLVNYRINYSGSLATFLASYNTDFDFIAIGADQNIIINTGALTNYEAVTEAIRYPFFFDWLEIGVKLASGRFKTQILYGDFRQIDTFYNANPSTYPMLKGMKSRQNYDSDDLNVANILNYQINENNIDFNLVLAYTSPDGQANPNTAIDLSPTGSYVNPQYPVVTYNGVNYVLVPEADQTTPKIKVYPVTESANTENSSGTQQVTPAITAEIAYKKTVAYIQAFKDTLSFKFDLAFKKLTLPGISNNVVFKREVKDTDGTVLYTQNINQTQTPTHFSGSGNEIFF